MDDETASLVARRRMVEQQLATRGITDARVLEAFMDVPRERFVPPSRRHLAYEDSALPLSLGQTISQPYVVALTVQELGPRPQDRVLDVGGGSGYQAAILARLVAQVYAIERLAELAQSARAALEELGVANVTVVEGDGSLGLPEHAPFDGIVCGAAAPQVPPEWIEQLADGGRIVVPLGDAEGQVLTVLEKHGDDIRRRPVCQVRFVPLIGRRGW